MQNSFDQKKASILQRISSTDEANPDASPKGSIDVHCVPLIDLINSNHDMVTTSSCSGRVSVYKEGYKDTSGGPIAVVSKGYEGSWIFITHDIQDLEGWYKKIDFRYYKRANIAESLSEKNRYILFKFEPLILHVKCRDASTANDLFTTAVNCGFRESGIGSNYNVAIRTSIRLDIPIGYVNNDNEIVAIVDEEYLKIITKQAEARFNQNFRKLDELYQGVSALNDCGSQKTAKETKEERRERKIREGLAKREKLKELKDQKSANLIP